MKWKEEPCCYLGKEYSKKMEEQDKSLLAWHAEAVTRGHMEVEERGREGMRLQEGLMAGDGDIPPGVLGAGKAWALFQWR